MYSKDPPQESPNLLSANNIFKGAFGENLYLNPRL